jgi:hypothetical protein
MTHGEAPLLNGEVISLYMEPLPIGGPTQPHSDWWRWDGTKWAFSYPLIRAGSVSFKLDERPLRAKLAQDPEFSYVANAEYMAIANALRPKMEQLYFRRNNGELGYVRDI